MRMLLCIRIREQYMRFSVPFRFWPRIAESHLCWRFLNTNLYHRNRNPVGVRETTTAFFVRTLPLT